MTATLAVTEQTARRKVGLSKLERGTYLQVRVKRQGIDVDQTVLLIEKIQVPSKGPVRFTCLTNDGRFVVFSDKQVVGVLGTPQTHSSLFKFPEPKPAPVPVVSADPEKVQRLVRYGSTDRLTRFLKTESGVVLVSITGLTGVLIVSTAKTYVASNPNKNLYLAAWRSPRNDIYSVQAETEADAFHNLCAELVTRNIL